MPQKLIYPRMTCTGEVDLHTDSGYRRIEKIDDVKGYGMRGLNVMRRGTLKDGKTNAIHLIDSVCKSHRLTIRSSYAAELLAAAHGYDDAYPSVVTIHELKKGPLTPAQLKDNRELGHLAVKVTLTMDAESVYKSLSSRDTNVPAEKTLLGHVVWIRELLQQRLIDIVQWCDTRDMTADGHTKGIISRDLLLKAMRGAQNFVHAVTRHAPFRNTKYQ